MGNDFITLFIKEPNETNNTDADETESTQSDETTPYMLDSDQDSSCNDDFSAGTTDSVDQPRSYTTKSGRATKMPKHLKTSNYNCKLCCNSQVQLTGQCHVLLLLKKRTKKKNRLNFVFDSI